MNAAESGRDYKIRKRKVDKGRYRSMAENLEMMEEGRKEKRKGR